MNHLRKLVFVLYIFIISNPILAQDIFKDVKACQCTHGHHLHEILPDFKSFIGEEYDLKYHRFQWSVDPDTIYIEGSVMSYFEVLDNDFNKIFFQLNDTLTVDSVRFHGVNLTYNRPGNHVLSINLPEIIPVGKLDSIEVFYKGYPGITSAFTRHEHETGSTLWTLSEPYGTKDWWPCKNNLSDKIDSIDTYITCPVGNEAGSNGLLMGSNVQGDKITYHWKHKYLIPAYLISIAVADYAVWENEFVVDGQEIPILNYAYPQDSAIARQRIESFLPALDWLNEVFIPYPYINEKYGHTQMGRGGGMEHTTMTTMGTWDWSVLVHEAVHQWFGNYITCGSWSDIWLNEGFATYFTGLAIENTYDPYWFDLWKSNLNKWITSEPGGSVYVYDTTNRDRVFSGRLSYYKAAKVLHLLKWTVGDDVFYEAVKSYLNDPKLAYNYALTEDLQYHFELVYGNDLDWFFDDWVYKEGYPEYEATVIPLSDEVIRFQLNQLQSHESVDFFELSVPVRFKNESNDTLLIVENEFSGQEYDLNIGFVPDSAFIDPNHDIISGVDTVVINSTSIEELDPIIFPVPANQEINILEGTILLESISLFDSSGRTVYNISFTEPTFSHIIETDDLVSGLYILFIEGKDRSFIKKVSIIH